MVFDVVQKLLLVLFDVFNRTFEQFVAGFELLTFVLKGSLVEFYVPVINILYQSCIVHDYLGYVSDK